MCKATMKSHFPALYFAGEWHLKHRHTCNGHHDADGNHFCPECRMWWFKA